LGSFKGFLTPDPGHITAVKSAAKRWFPWDAVRSPRSKNRGKVCRKAF
jgi:hypothetical protein